MHESEAPPAPKRRRGRGQPGTTPELEARVISLALAGNHLDTIARAVGVTPSLLKRWLASHSRTDFRERYEMACGEAEARNVAIIASAAAGQHAKDAEHNIAAAMWLLERRWPDRWARLSQRDKASEVTPKDVSSSPFAEVDELAERKRKSGRGVVT